MKISESSMWKESYQPLCGDQGIQVKMTCACSKWGASKTDFVQ